MRVTLLESGRSFIHTAECATGSLLLHAGIVVLAVGLTGGGSQLPNDEREARVFFLLPPDRVDQRVHQTEVLQWGRLGGDNEDGKDFARSSEGWRVRREAHGARRDAAEDRGGARGQVPIGPPPGFVPDSVFSVLEVDETVERHAGSAAPVYPPDLLAIGAEGVVEAIYVVDTAGRVDTATVEVTRSDDPRFTESVRAALADMLFRPARRAGKPVRQLVQQQFRFRIVPADQIARQLRAPGS